MGFDQKSGKRKYPRLNFVQYLETGVRDTKSGVNVSNEKILNAAKH